MEGLVNYSSEDDQDEQSSDHVAERGTPVKRGRNQNRADDSPLNITGSDNGSQRASNTTASSAYQRKRSSPHGRERVRDRGSHTREEDVGPHHRHSKHSNGNRFGSSSASARYREDSSAGKESRGTKASRDHRDTPRMDNRNRSKEYKNDNRDQRRRDNERDNERDHHSGTSGRGTKSYSSASSFTPSKGRHNDDRHGRHNDFTHSKQYQKNRKDRHDRQTRRQRSPERNSGRDQRNNGREVVASRSRSRTNSSRSRSNSTGRDQSKRLDKQQSGKRSSTALSRSHTPPRSRSGSREMTSKPLEKARLTALQMEKKIKMFSTETYGDEDANGSTAAATNTPVPVRPIVPLMSLPLSDSAPKLPNLIAITSTHGGVGSSGGTAATNNSGEPSVIQLPSYYNRSAINPTKYAEQVQKRKLIWGAKKAEDTASKWGHAQFSEDSDGKVASKFMRLMGMKGAAAPKPQESSETSTSTSNTVLTTPDVKSREAMFTNMEQQYEVARQTTHTMRGVGLGFSSQARPF